MGVYIKGINKPESCNDCPLCGYDERQSMLFCRVDNADIEQDIRRDDCPLIEIDLVRCGECIFADENNHCEYGELWNYNADFCSHGIRRKKK